MAVEQLSATSRGEFDYIELTAGGMIDTKRIPYLGGFLGEGEDSFAVRWNLDEVIKLYVRHKIEELPLSLDQVARYAKTMNQMAEYFDEDGHAFSMPGVSKPIEVKVNPVEQVGLVNNTDWPASVSKFIPGYRLIEVGDLARNIQRAKKLIGSNSNNSNNQDLLLLGMNLVAVDSRVKDELLKARSSLGMGCQTDICASVLNIKTVMSSGKITLMITDLGVSIRDVIA